MIRRAKITDVPRIAELITQHARSGKMLFRSHAELFETLRDFVVYESDEADIASPSDLPAAGSAIAAAKSAAKMAPVISGVCALEIVWSDLAEVKSLAVDAAFQRRGIGRTLVEAVIAEAEELRIARVFSLTYEKVFFEKLGFAVVDKSALPLKVWSDCIKCPKRDGCDEIAMVRTLLAVPALQESDPDSVAELRYDVPTPLVKLNISRSVPK